MYRWLIVAVVLVSLPVAVHGQEVSTSLRTPGLAAPGDSVRLWLDRSALTGRFLGFRAESLAIRRHDRTILLDVGAIDGLDVRAREPVLFLLAGGVSGGLLALLLRNVSSPTVLLDKFLCPLCEHDRERTPAATALVSGFVIGGAVAVTYNFFHPTFVPRYRRLRE